MRFVHLACAVALLLLTLLFLPSGGTTDVALFAKWMDAMQRDGLVQAYADAYDVYPPLAWVILRGVVAAAAFSGIALLPAFKVSLLVFLALTSVVCLAWSKNLVNSAILHVSLLLNSVALGYVDIYLAPTFLLSLWALRNRRVFLFAALFTISSLIKWQPLIVAPFFAVHVVRLVAEDRAWRSAATRFGLEAVLPATLIAGAVMLPFGWASLAAFTDALSQQTLSGNALNYNWLVTHYLHVAHPERFGPLVDGMSTFVRTDEWSIVAGSKLLFVAFYLWTLGCFIARPAAFETTLRFALAGYLAYFTFNVGVHENHWFLASLLAVAWHIAARNPRHWVVAILVIANVNLFLFYGVSGTVPFNRVAGIDLAVPLSILSVALFLWFWWSTIRRRQEPLPS
jgi:hypothetical protein